MFENEVKKVKFNYSKRGTGKNYIRQNDGTAKN